MASDLPAGLAWCQAHIPFVLAVSVNGVPVELGPDQELTCDLPEHSMGLHYDKILDVSWWEGPPAAAALQVIAEANRGA